MKRSWMDLVSMIIDINLYDLLWTLKLFREERKVRKWRKMIGVGGSDWKHYARRKPHVVKRRIRKGIPDCLRGLVWQLISGSRDLLLMNPGVYEVLLHFSDMQLVSLELSLSIN